MSREKQKPLDWAQDLKGVFSRGGPGDGSFSLSCIKANRLKTNRRLILCLRLIFAPCGTEHSAILQAHQNSSPSIYRRVPFYTSGTGSSCSVSRDQTRLTCDFKVTEQPLLFCEDKTCIKTAGCVPKQMRVNSCTQGYSGSLCLGTEPATCCSA